MKILPSTQQSNTKECQRTNSLLLRLKQLKISRLETVNNKTYTRNIPYQWFQSNNQYWRWCSSPNDSGIGWPLFSFEKVTSRYERRVIYHERLQSQETQKMHCDIQAADLKWESQRLSYFYPVKPCLSRVLLMRTSVTECQIRHRQLLTYTVYVLIQKCSRQ